MQKQKSLKIFEFLPIPNIYKHYIFNILYIINYIYNVLCTNIYTLIPQSGEVHKGSYEIMDTDKWKMIKGINNMTWRIKNTPTSLKSWEVKDSFNCSKLIQQNE